MNLYDIKIGYKHVQMFYSIHQCLQAYTSINMLRGQLLKLPQGWKKRKSSIALMVEVNVYVHSF